MTRTEKCHANNLRNLKPKSFEELFNYVDRHQKELSQEDAVVIIVKCSHVCIESSKNCISDEKHLKKILKTVFCLITELNEKQLLYYVTSVFHIVKHLVSEDLHKTVIEIEDILWPPFLPLNLPTNIAYIYSNLSKLLSNIIVKCLEDPKLIHCSVLVRISEISAKIFSTISSPLEYLVLSVNAFVRLGKFEISVEQYKDHYIYILKQIRVEKIKENILEFYQSVLFCCGAIVHYTILKSDFERAKKILCEIEDFTIGIFGKHSCISNLFELLKLPIIISPLNPKTIIQKLANYYDVLDKFSNSEAIKYKQDVGKRLSFLVNAVMKSYAAENKNIWIKFSEKQQLEIFKCIYKISELENHGDFKCSCGCSVKVNSNETVPGCHTILSVLQISLNECKNISSHYHEMMISLLTKFVDKISHLAENSCQNWIPAWKFLGTGICSIGGVLYNKQDAEALNYFLFFIRHAIKFQKINFESVNSSLLSVSIQTICSMNLMLKDWRKCLAYCALGVFLNEQDADNIMHKWIKCKHQMNGERRTEICSITTVEAFRIFSPELHTVINPVDLLKKEDEIRLLTIELEQYKKRWKSQVPMIAALTELSNRINNAEKLAEIITRIFGDSNLLFHETVLGIAKTLLMSIEKDCSLNKGNSEPKLYLSVLHFLNYKSCINKVIEKHVMEMEQTEKLLPKKLISDVPLDPKEECDIISSYENLMLDKYLKNLKYLDSSLTIIEKYFSDILISNDDMGMYHILIKIALEYRLIGNKIQYIKALNLAVEIAKCEENVSKIIYSVSLLIEYCDVRSEYIKKLITESDKMIENRKDATVKNKVILTYHICKAKALLYLAPKESYRNYKIAYDMFNLNTAEEYLGDVRYLLLFLKLKYITMPCDIVNEVHSENAFDVFASIPSGFHYISLIEESTYKIPIVLDTNEELVKFYRGTRCPKDVRNFSRDLAQVTQKLMLPLRCCSYLMYLSYADLYTHRLDDCQVKLDDAAKILCFSKRDICHNWRLQSDMELENLCKAMDEINLNHVENKQPVSQTLSSSPVFTRQYLNLPTFIQHQKTCTCFFCNCVEYQDLVFKRIHLEALLNMKKNDIPAAIQSFTTGLNLYEFLKNKPKTYKTANNFKFAQDLLDLSIEFMETIGYILLDFAKLAVNINQQSIANALNERLVKLIQPHKLKYIHLYKEALIQRLGLLTIVPQIQIIVTSPIETIDGTVKTPERNFNKVSVTVDNLSPSIPSIGKLPVRVKLDFECSPENKKKQTDVCKKEKINNVAPTVKKTLLPPKKGRTRNPKINIYTENEENVRVTSAKPTIAGKKSEMKSEVVTQVYNEIKIGRRELPSRKNIRSRIKSVNLGD